ncbi:CBO0543 family protein [Bacillus sp. FSL K6-3431]|uniref:CBO0543 family protein n=1 Tax=Bacillus sp. FSL K6-3431 TaxID=2921500 RepID=UPI0030FCC1E9
MKHLKILNLWQWLKKQFPLNLIHTILFATLLGTYLDLYFVGKGIYEFPIRPFSDIFTINIVFTLLGLPILTLLFLIIMNKLSRLNRFIYIFLFSFAVPTIEGNSERLGFFQHSDSWKHIYSFFGYFLFFIVVWKVYKWNKIGSK